MADALATLASVWEEPNKVQGKPLIMTKANHPYFQKEEVVCFTGPQEKPWFYDVLKFLETWEYPEESTSKQRYGIRLQSRNYTFHDNVLYRRSPFGTLLRCVMKEEANGIMKDVHAGVCGPHMSGPVLSLKI